MNQQDTQQEPPVRKTGRDRWVKIGFVILLIVVAVVIFMLQRRGLAIKDWGKDLDAALRQAKAEDRPIVVFFVNRPPSDPAKTIRTRIQKPGNQQALKDGKFIPVIVELSSSLDSDTARRYEVRELPTLMVLTSDGEERNRHEGNIGEVPFRQKLLENSN
ncbi:hypothetical protein LCGC14_2663070 [marine sediment metagenome]|uniref:Thioredoxin domain-containing protein n=1 Tax=marine sediment metagenome TaxID=412755 RepID=A0A0F8ZRC0_9ZZZZ